MKAEKAKFNTHIANTVGVIVREEKDMKPQIDGVCIRFTSDSGEAETISLECDGVMIVVAFPPVEQLIRETRKDRR